MSFLEDLYIDGVDEAEKKEVRDQVFSSYLNTFIINQKYSKSQAHQYSDNLFFGGYMYGTIISKEEAWEKFLTDLDSLEEKDEFNVVFPLKMHLDVIYYQPASYYISGDSDDKTKYFARRTNSDYEKSPNDYLVFKYNK